MATKFYFGSQFDENRTFAGISIPGSTTRVKENQDHGSQDDKRDRSQCEDQVGYYFTTAQSALLFDAFLFGLGTRGFYLIRPSSPG